MNTQVPGLTGGGEAAFLLPLWLILVVGIGIGTISIRGFSLGIPAVLLVGLGAGAFGIDVPNELRSFGMLLFAYSVGLQIGPRFLPALRKEGWRFLLMGTVPIVLGFLLTLGLCSWVGLPSDATVGLYAASLTNTSSFAAALDAIGPDARLLEAGVVVSFAFVYPLSMVLVVFGAQAVPRWFRRDIETEDRWWTRQRSDMVPVVERTQVRILNGSHVGKPLNELQLRARFGVTITRLTRGARAVMPSATEVLEVGDVVTIMGSKQDLRRVADFLGQAMALQDEKQGAVFQYAEISSQQLAGHSLRELQLPTTDGVMVSHFIREDLEYPATSDRVLEIGDRLGVFGAEQDVRAFIKKAGPRAHLVSETSMFAFLLGLLLAVLLERLSVTFPGGWSLRCGLGAAGFLVGALWGHCGRIGPVRMYVPLATRNFCRDFGLMLFFVAAGTTAGGEVSRMLSLNGVLILGVGIAITAGVVCASILLSKLVCRFTTVETLGGVLGILNNPAAFAAAREGSASGALVVAYGTVYPIALVTKTLLSQVLVYVVR